ncbi:hypothetical protein [uncultured Endozoicomonas sp.]|uniref:hypothetical protein n=1 Tax=uncultured Endozoicomonas sp. TaxID=432652 RepID=UPI00260339B8|nr:hypothetical protein [uncultured Endozoicomonas sp.]
MSEVIVIFKGNKEMILEGPVICADQKAQHNITANMQVGSTDFGRTVRVMESLGKFTASLTNGYSACKTLESVASSVQIIMLLGFFSMRDGADSRHTYIPDCKKCGSTENSQANESVSNQSEDGSASIVDLSSRNHCDLYATCSHCFRDGDMSVVEEPPPPPPIPAAMQNLIVAVKA